MKKNFTTQKLLFCVGFAMSLETSALGAPSPEALRAMDFFNKLDQNHLSLVDDFYDKNVDFQDPIHKLHGSDAVKNYYGKLYRDVKSIRFEFVRNVSEQESTVLEWKMFLTTDDLNSGKEFSVDGTSVISFGGKDGKAVKHRDYFDMGEFIYERLPILKSIIQIIKNKLGGV